MIRRSQMFSTFDIVIITGASFHQDFLLSHSVIPSIVAGLLDLLQHFDTAMAFVVFTCESIYSRIYPILMFYVGVGWLLIYSIERICLSSAQLRMELETDMNRSEV